MQQINQNSKANFASQALENAPRLSHYRSMFCFWLASFYCDFSWKLWWVGRPQVNVRALSQNYSICSQFAEQKARKLSPLRPAGNHTSRLTVYYLNPKWAKSLLFIELVGSLKQNVQKQRQKHTLYHNTEIAKVFLFFNCSHMCQGVQIVGKYCNG